MPASNTAATASVDTKNPVLAGEKISFAADHFDEKCIEVLSARAEELSASIVETADEATILLTNPASPSYASDVEAFQTLVTERPSSLPPIRLLPYHWLSTCYHRNAKIPLSQLSIRTPYFINPRSPGNVNYPLKIWVSVNIRKIGNESPYEAQQTVIERMELSGAISISKRGGADVLIVDKESKFYVVVESEMKNGRTDSQVVAQRDWVESCLKARKLVWRSDKPFVEKRLGDGNGNGSPVVGGEGISSSPVEMMFHGGTGSSRRQGQNKSSQTDGNGDEIRGDGSDNDDADSFGDEAEGREHMQKQKKGLGRPTGKPRVDYSGEDDDFLCRYLAFHNPAGSWGSRKTFQLMAANVATYPIIERHTWQSWHERFKKNNIVFQKRVNRYIQAGIDENLKTHEERERAAGQAPVPVPLVQTQQAQPDPAPAIHGEQTRPISKSTSGKSRLEARTIQSTLPQAGLAGRSEAVATTSTAGAGLLVALDDEQAQGAQTDTTPIAAGNAVAGPSTSTVPEIVTTTTDQLRSENALVSAPGLPTVAQATEDVQLRVTTTLNATDSIAERVAIEQTLQPELLVPERQTTREPSEASQYSAAPPAPIPAAGDETQALLSDFARAKAAAAAVFTRNATPPPKRHTSQQRSPRKAASPHPAVAAASTSYKPMRVSEYFGRSGRGLASTPQQNNTLNGMTARTGGRLSMPGIVHLGVDSVEVDIGGKIYELEKSPYGTPRRSPLVEQFEHGRPVPPISLGSSSKKSRRSLGGVGGSEYKHSPLSTSRPRARSPDRVYASTAIPPPRKRHYTELATPEADDAGLPERSKRRRNGTDRPSSPPLVSEEERAQSIHRGQELVLRQRDEYRRNIVRLTSEYGLTAKELIGFMQDVKAREGKGGGSWARIEEELQNRYR